MGEGGSRSAPYRRVRILIFLGRSDTHLEPGLFLAGGGMGAQDMLSGGPEARVLLHPEYQVPVGL